ncbi:MAG: MerR family DNA-binding protein [Actinomycetota bacterium]|nr:MerR family DNA-binding protein [Actinomycetota bacterium]
MTIGDIAVNTGTSWRAIRLYEAQGLLPVRRRTPNGYRLFEESDVRLIRFIRAARVLGFSLGDIREILTITGAGQVPCHRVRELIGQRIYQIDTAIASLQALRSGLVKAQRMPERGSAGVEEAERPCPIIAHAAAT